MALTQTALIQIKVSDNIATIAFDNYAKRNALSAVLITEMLAALEEFKAKDVRAVVLRSAVNEKVWSAGHDVRELLKADTDPLPYNDPLEQLLRAVKAFPAPVMRPAPLRSRQPNPDCPITLRAFELY